MLRARTGSGSGRCRRRGAGLALTPRPRRPLPAQRQRVPRGDARRREGAVRLGQRELPLRRRRAAPPAPRQPGHRRSCSTAPSARPSPRCCPTCPTCELLLQVDDGTGLPLLDGAVDYEAALAAPCARRPRPACRPTTSTSSTPAARPACPRACCGGRPTSWPRASASPARPLTSSTAARRSAPAGAGRAAVHARRRALERHQRLVLRGHRGDPGHAEPARPRRHPPHGRRASEATSLLIVGDAFARPLVDALRTGRHDVGRLRHLLTGGAVLSANVKEELLALVPGLRIVDVLGSSETGRQGVHTSDERAAGDDRDLRPVAHRGRPVRGPLPPPRARRPPTWGGWPRGAGCRSATSGTPTRRPAPSRRSHGRPLRRGRRPRPAARPTAAIELHGRDSVDHQHRRREGVRRGGRAGPQAPSGAVRHRRGRAPSPQWGQEVVAVVQLRPGAEATTDAELTAAAAPHLARYKLPKGFVRVLRDRAQPERQAGLPVGGRRRGRRPGQVGPPTGVAVAFAPHAAHDRGPLRHRPRSFARAPVRRPPRPHDPPGRPRGAPGHPHP